MMPRVPCHDQGFSFHRKGQWQNLKPHAGCHRARHALSERGHQVRTRRGQCRDIGLRDRQHHIAQQLLCGQRFVHGRWRPGTALHIHVQVLAEAARRDGSLSQGMAGSHQRHPALFQQLQRVDLRLAGAEMAQVQVQCNVAQGAIFGGCLRLEAQRRLRHLLSQVQGPGRAKGNGYALRRPHHEAAAQGAQRHAAFASFQVAAVLAVLSGTMLFAAVVFVPLFLQQGLGLTPVRTALATLPLMLGITIGGQFAGRALRGGVSLARVGGFAALWHKLGFVALAAVLHWLPQHGVLQTSVAVALALLPAGLGLGLLFPLVSIVAQRSPPAAQLGVATATPVMLRALGGSLGVAVLGELLREHMAAAVAHGLHSPHDAMLALAGGTARIAAIAAAVAVAAFMVSRGLAKAGSPGQAPRPKSA
jgi:hypothetical protein